MCATSGADGEGRPHVLGSRRNPLPIRPRCAATVNPPTSPMQLLRSQRTASSPESCCPATEAFASRDVSSGKLHSPTRFRARKMV
jgi:hypothetical protein